MGLLIDTGVLISLERSGARAADTLEQWADETWFLSVISVSELLHGVHRAVDPGIRLRREAFVELALQEFPIIPIDVGTARIHSLLWAELSARGKMIGVHDSWLAATCISLELRLLTLNRREFERVPGLKVEPWEEPR